MRARGALHPVLLIAVLLIAAVMVGGAGHLAAQPTGGTPAPPPRGNVEITVTAGAGGTMDVVQRYDLPRTAAPTEFRFLHRPCVDVREVRFEADGSWEDVSVSDEGPWTVLRDTTHAVGSGALQLVIRYVARTHGAGVDLPLIHATESIPQTDGAREGNVHLRVRFGDESSRVAFPHMKRQDRVSWSARYVGVPSFLGVSLGGGDRGSGGDCMPPAEPSGDSGGLIWRFFLLVGIMVAWVPIYLTWARRSAQDAG